MLGSALASTAFTLNQKVKAEEKKHITTNNNNNDNNNNLPTFTMAEVAKHKTKETGMWVIFKGEVYDITEFVEGHPGGKEKIALAAGGDVEDFWFLYPIHYNNPAVRDVLDQYRIGKLDPEVFFFFFGGGGGGDEKNWNTVILIMI